MTDAELVRRLRHPDCVDAKCVKCRAADRIERLRRALKLMLQESEGEFDDDWRAYCQEEARDTLA
jgi:hypothetical protein